jgi:hypothetical protein
MMLKESFIKDIWSFTKNTDNLNTQNKKNSITKKYPNVLRSRKQFHVMGVHEMRVIQLKRSSPSKQYRRLIKLLSNIIYASRVINYAIRLR